MQNTLATLPLATRTTGPSQALPESSSAANAISSGVGANTATQSWSAILKAVHGHHHHHGGTGASGASAVGSSTDAFGASSSGSSPSVDAFGAPSVKPSSGAALVAAISDPFSSIASNLSVQAQLQSQQLLEL
jgi:hypothetical protein